VATQAVAENILQKATGKKRIFAAIAGPPASGKTTLTESLRRILAKTTSVAVVAMDGFHYDNDILRGLNLLEGKGSPHTFDVGSLQLLLTGLQNQTDLLAVPVFDRKNDLARSSALLIQPEDQIILVEGNYLLCNTRPWNKLNALFDYSVYIRVSESVLEERLIQRWLDHNHTIEQAKFRTHNNDLPNAKYVIEHSSQADYDLIQ